MSETKDIPLVNSYRVGLSHRARAKEGHILLAQGKSLTEMETPIIGSSSEELNARRKEYIDSIKKTADKELIQTKQNLLNQLQKAEKSGSTGTSELNWRNIIINAEMEQRGLNFNETPNPK